ncbi:Uma2 family endonuclease [Saccharopolyspora antimicrobica]|uniref:Uma2 family endonuclease n=1 Tax=Saccharopolyspora antimicrobica TaxID=455193 RepID=UPI001FEBE2B7|nr:Uma2 family endonuclease [Saccharopolyspora antimicrobica]
MSSWTDEHEPMTVDDLKQLPDDGRRYELVDGRLDVSPSPVFRHSDTESRLHLHLGNNAPKGYKVLQGAGYNFNGNRRHHRIPDLSVIHSDAAEFPYLTRPPLLAIEVVSPESVLRDHHTKHREYAEFGIQAYWIVTPAPDEPGIIEFRLSDGAFRNVQQVIGEDTFTTDFPFPIRIVPHWLLCDDDDWRDRIGGEGD